MSEPTTKSIIQSRADSVLMTVVGKALEGRQDPSARHDQIFDYAIGKRWAEVLERFPDVSAEWVHRKALRRSHRSRCFYRDAKGYTVAPGYDGAKERERYALANLEWVKARNTRPNINSKAERLRDATAFLEKHKGKVEA